MGVLKEMTCLAHGDYETSEDPPNCKFGCDCVERRFRSPPAVFRSGRTANIDKTLDGLSKSYGLTDLGPAAMRRKALAAEKAQAQYKEFCVRRFGGFGWGGVPAGGTMNSRTMEVKGEGPGAPAAAANVGATGSVTNETVKEMLPAHMPARIRVDPDKLTLADARAP